MRGDSKFDIFATLTALAGMIVRRSIGFFALQGKKCRLSSES